MNRVCNQVMSQAKYKYLLTLQFDIRPESVQGYYRYVLQEFVPSMQKMGLPMRAAWHTAYGDYPMRQLDFLAEDLNTIRSLLADSDWKRLESGLQEYITHYQHKVMDFDETRFQW